GTVLASLAAGPLIDRITAVRVLPGFLAPMALGLLVIWGFERAVWALPYLFLLGLTSGIVFTAVTALWAEIYGVRHLGAIRSLVVSLSVLSSALGPLVMGALMDAGVSVETICGLFALYCVGATGLQMLGLRRLR
ncbi:MAG: MFS transporter, partial [Kiloniellales bacterium]